MRNRINPELLDLAQKKLDRIGPQPFRDHFVRIHPGVFATSNPDLGKRLRLPSGKFDFGGEIVKIGQVEKGDGPIFEEK